MKIMCGHLVSCGRFLAAQTGLLGVRIVTNLKLQSLESKLSSCSLRNPPKKLLLKPKSGQELLKILESRSAYGLSQ